MILAAAALACPLVGIAWDDPTTAHRVEMDGLPMKDWATADFATARCGARVKLRESRGEPCRWKDLRTRGTGVKRCTGCNPRRRVA